MRATIAAVVSSVRLTQSFTASASRESADQPVDFACPEARKPLRFP